MKKTSDSLFLERYTNLNKAQKQAVDTIDGPLLVVAGPGSGKTEILSLRVAKILRESQVLPSNILCLTFTESATLNMRDRLSRLIGQEAYRVAIHTFHSFASEVIQKYPEYFYKGAKMTPADDLAKIGILEELFKKLPHGHVLSGYHPEQGFVFLGSIHSAISHLKRAGILPHEFRVLLEENKTAFDYINGYIQNIFDGRMNKSLIPQVEEFVFGCMGKAQKERMSTLAFPTIYEALAQSLGLALSRVKEEGSTKALSEWKEKWVKKTEDGKRVHKDFLHTEKLFALASLYEAYIEQMHVAGLYDFDDMILDTITALEKYPQLRFELQEQYHYVLVDEFQDTNDAQMRLLRTITDTSVNEGRPNIMAVGDDDQAVFKFQGAELSNILNFNKSFKDVTMVTMTENYRSTQDILDLASHIIRKGEGRLENILPALEKNLIASNKKLGGGNIVHRRCSTSLHQYHFVSREIKKLIENGVPKDEIAVIARRHKDLEALVPFMKGVSVPVRYNREQNVFEEPHIRELIVMSRFVASLARHSHKEADELLPVILSFPFWNISREDVWRISLESARAYDPEKTWLEIMLSHTNDKIRSIAQFFVDLGVRALHEPAERVLDELIGAHMPLGQESEDDEEDDSVQKTELLHSPFKAYYFSKERFEHARAEYLTFLSSLRVFVKALREFKKGEMTTVLDLVEFVDLHEKNNIRLHDQSPWNSIEDAVSLLTAHAAKGLEFENVFILSCDDKEWVPSPRPKKISFPHNLPIEPAGEMIDDHLRLFYVALTRAKKHLYLISYAKNDKGEDVQKLRFLVAPLDDEEVLSKKVLEQVYHSVIEGDGDGDAPITHEVLTSSWISYHTAPFLGEEEKLLKSLVKDYAMPVTHLNNFLNVVKGGPQHFLEQNLLRFPQAKNTSSSFGSAIHSTLEEVLTYHKVHHSAPHEDVVCDWFVRYLRFEKLPEAEFVKTKERGLEALRIFYKQKISHFTEKDIAEFNFKNQGVVVGGVPLTGKIDRIVKTENGSVEVHDYKTGKAIKSWQGKDEYEKIKLYEYERQLAFYRILAEGSREFSGARVLKGVLEFVEPKDGTCIDLEADIPDEKVERLKRLIVAVYRRIQHLEFDDVSKYPQTLDGIIQFEDDILEK